MQLNDIARALLAELTPAQRVTYENKRADHLVSRRVTDCGIPEAENWATKWLSTEDRTEESAKDLAAILKVRVDAGETLPAFLMAIVVHAVDVADLTWQIATLLEITEDRGCELPGAPVESAEEEREV